MWHLVFVDVKLNQKMQNTFRRIRNVTLWN